MKFFNDLMPVQKRETTEDNKNYFHIAKADDDRRLAFGWANIAISEDGEQLVDWQEDMIDEEDLENAAYNFVEFYRVGGEMHEVPHVAVLVESVIFTAEKQKAMGIPEGVLPIGWWIGFHVLDDGVWEKVKSGEYSMFSIEGRAKRVEIDDDGNEVSADE